MDLYKQLFIIRQHDTDMKCIFRIGNFNLSAQIVYGLADIFYADSVNVCIICLRTGKDAVFFPYPFCMAVIDRDDKDGILLLQIRLDPSVRTFGCRGDRIVKQIPQNCDHGKIIDFQTWKIACDFT